MSCKWSGDRIQGTPAHGLPEKHRNFGILAFARDEGFSLKGIERDETKFANPDNDPRGAWMSRSILGLATRDQRPNLHYDIIEPKSGRVFQPNPSTGWRYSKEKMGNYILDNGNGFC